MMGWKKFWDASKLESSMPHSTLNLTSVEPLSIVWLNQPAPFPLLKDFCLKILQQLIRDQQAELVNRRKIMDINVDTIQYNKHFNWLHVNMQVKKAWSTLGHWQEYSQTTNYKQQTKRMCIIIIQGDRNLRVVTQCLWIPQFECNRTEITWNCTLCVCVKHTLMQKRSSIY